MFKSMKSALLAGLALTAIAAAPVMADPIEGGDGIVPYRGSEPVGRAVVRGEDPSWQGRRLASPAPVRRPVVQDQGFAVPPAPAAPREEARSGWSLPAYEIEMARYYTMLKCRHASNREQMRQWKLVTEAHYALAGRTGGRAMKAAQSRALASAEEARCY